MNRWKSAIRQFHEDESGMEPLMVVMVVAIGAVILLVLIKMWSGTIKPWFTEKVTGVTEMKED